MYSEQEMVQKIGHLKRKRRRGVRFSVDYRANCYKKSSLTDTQDGTSKRGRSFNTNSNSRIGSARLKT